LQGSGGGFPLRPSDFKRDTGVIMAILMIKGEELIVDDEDVPIIQMYAWHISNPGKRNKRYFRTTTKKDGNKKCVYMHRFLLGVEDRSIEVDHINSNSFDNRRVNLRLCDHTRNCQNSILRSDNVSGFKGVSRYGEKWQAHITSYGIHIMIGVYDTPELASKAYAAKAKELHGEYMRLR
jgi:hypothetical protein